MRTNFVNIKKYRLAPLVLVIVFFFLFSSQAEASIVVNGNRGFTDDVNECLNTYRRVPGIVGDAIRELENSSNEHRIINSTDWTNTVNDGDNAFNGAGTGTVTRVDKAELEVYKTSFPELLNKDFCTALLHELWHAVDADRGEWSLDKLGGIKRNEIEATVFQNFVHAIRGVDPRTSYGRVDISQFVLVGDDGEKNSVTTLAPTTIPTPTPTAKTETSVSTSFKHVAPGSYSEIYVIVTTGSGANIKITLSGPGVDSTPTQTSASDEKGIAKFTWKIVSFGNYNVSGIVNGESFSSRVNVQ